MAATLLIEEIGCQLRQAMTEKRVSIYDLAARSRVAPEAIADIIGGRAQDIEITMMVALFTSLDLWPQLLAERTLVRAPAPRL